MDVRTLTELIDQAVELLRDGYSTEATAILVEIQERTQLDQAELRRAVLSRSRTLRISDRDVVSVLAASRAKADVPGDPADIPAGWRQSEVIGYIAPMSNIPSIVNAGIFSHNDVREIPHISVANVEVQGRRADREVQHPDGRSVPLHNYANLYVNPRNAMMYRVRSDDVAVVMVDAQRTFVHPGARLSPRNAAVGVLETYPLPHGLRYVDPDVIYSDSWTTPNGPDETRKQAMQAEVLVPDHVPPDLITLIGVRNEGQRQRLVSQIPSTKVVVAPVLYFDR